MNDRHVEAVRAKMLARSIVGMSKYNCTTERTDLSEIDWLRHAQEESMDLCVYLERLINDKERAAANAPAGD